MLKNKKTTGRGDENFRWLAGRAAALFIGIGLVFAWVGEPAWAESFGVSSARDGGGTPYIENNSFGTNREGGEAFWTDPQTGDRHFRTPEMPKKYDEPDQIEILPVQPEIYPVVPKPKDPIIIRPDGSGQGRPGK